MAAGKGFQKVRKKWEFTLGKIPSIEIFDRKKWRGDEISARYFLEQGTYLDRFLRSYQFWLILSFCDQKVRGNSTKSYNVKVEH